MAIVFDVFGGGDCVFEGLFGGALCGRCVFWCDVGLGDCARFDVDISKVVIAARGVAIKSRCFGIVSSRDSILKGWCAQE